MFSIGWRGMLIAATAGLSPVTPESAGSTGDPRQTGLMINELRERSSSTQSNAVQEANSSLTFKIPSDTRASVLSPLATHDDARRGAWRSSSGSKSSGRPGFRQRACRLLDGPALDPGVQVEVAIEDAVTEQDGAIAERTVRHCAVEGRKMVEIDDGGAPTFGKGEAASRAAGGEKTWPRGYAGRSTLMRRRLARAVPPRAPPRVADGLAIRGFPR